jgi:hypothetical protein
MLVVRLDKPDEVKGLLTAAQYLEHPEVAGHA